MKLRVASTLLLAIIITLLTTWWLYPIKSEAISVVAIISSCIALLLSEILVRCYEFLTENKP